MALGVSVTTRTAPPSRGAPTDTGTWFLVGLASTVPNPNVAVKCRSLADFVGAYGVRAAGNQAFYDEVDLYFREGGQTVYTSGYTAGGIDAALALFTKDLGPGQVSAPQETPGTVTYGKLYDHAQQNNRFAIGDGTSTATVTTLTTLGGNIPTTNPEYGIVVGQYVTCPGPAGVIGAGPRTVAGSAVVAALCARVDQLGNPNRAAAGRDFPLQYATGFALTVTDVQRSTLLNVGINTFAVVYGVLELYGFQTGLAQNPDNPFWQANVSRVRMWITAQGLAIGENYMFKPIDGRGRIAGAFKTDLMAMLLHLYQVDGLYGPTPGDAFAVEVGAAVNTVATIAQGELHAVMEVRPDLHAKAILIDLVTVPITGVIS